MRKRIDQYVIDLNSCIGKGAFGQVYKGVVEKTNKEVAVKILFKKKMECEVNTREAYITEIRIMRKLKSDNIVEFIDVVQTENNYYVIQEYCNGGDLRQKINLCKRFTQKDAVGYLKDILSGFVTLIQNGVIHRDVKPQNILINNNKMKIADFGFAKVVLSFSQLNKTLVGTPLYMSPQLLTQQRYTSKCDIWSIGIMTYQLLYGKLPWIANSQVQLYNNMTKTALKFDEKIEISNQFKDFISGCLKVNQSDRFSWKDVFSHNIFGDTFKIFIEKHNQQQRKFKEVLNNLRIFIHRNDVDLQKIFDLLQLKDNSILSKEIVEAVMINIQDGDKVSDEFKQIIKKLDKNNQNTVTVQTFKQLLKANGIQVRSVKKRKGQGQNTEQNNNEQQLLILKTVIKKLKDRMKQSGIVIQQLYVSYAKSKTAALNFQKFQKLFLKIDKNLNKNQLKLCFTFFDTDKDGQVTFKDFETTLKQYG